MIDDVLLIGWLAKTLEPGRVVEVEEALAASPALRARLSVLSAELRAREAPPPPWRIPAPGVPRGREAPRPHLELPLHLGPSGLHPGDAFTIRIAPPPGDRRLVVLYRHTTGWQVSFPEREGDDVRLADLPHEPDGSVLVHLVTTEEEGTQRWAVALPEVSIAVAWDAEGDARWGAVQEGIAAGSVPVFSVEVEVSPRP